MFSTTDTIVAIATPPGRGGIGVVRLSGSDAQAMARALITHSGPLQPRHATFSTVRLKPDTTDVSARDTNISDRDVVTSDRVPMVRLEADSPEVSACDTSLSDRDVVTADRVPMVRLEVDSPDAPARDTDISDRDVVTSYRVPMVRVEADGRDASARISNVSDRDAVTSDRAPVVSGFSRTQAETIDQAVVTFFPAPHSYTGDDVVELSAHGSPVVLQEIVRAALTLGARLAEPGEFTLRAFLNGRIDLMQAEAVNDLIDAVTPLQARAAFDQLNGTLTSAIAAIDATLFDLIARLEASVDFSEEGYHFIEPGGLVQAIDGLLDQTSSLLGAARRGRMIREGLQIAIVGEPNVGKSSLFNALAGASRAIVTDVPGTTRDLVTEVVDIGGLRVTLVDTAGLRDTDDPVEVEGVARARQSMTAADLVLLVEDRSHPRSRRAFIESRVLYVANKTDLIPLWDDDRAVCVSATTGAGLEELRHRIVAAIDFDPLRDRPAMTNVRHIALVDRAQGALLRARDAARAEGGSLSEEFVLADLAEARAAFEEISGRRAPEDLLEHIFARFCIGK
jgi:tRNA modification GTPase